MKLYLKDELPLHYFSGSGSAGVNEADLIKKGGIKYRCYSYAYTCKEGFYYQKKIAESLKYSVGKNIGIMMDSSAFSFHSLIKQGKRKTGGKWNVDNIETLRDQVIGSYVDYVKKNKKDW